MSQQELRAEWHRKFAMPRIQQIFKHVPTYWLKDDHDHRFDDSDTVNANKKFGPLPSHELGVNTFIEQVPITDPENNNPITYRTIRINALLQIWMVEGRDYRTPNRIPDGPEKSIWGKTQMDWLKTTLLESDAVFKILVNPTPMVGPDGASKIDNHTNPKGFRHEGDEFFKWLKKSGFLKENFYMICGDRHWQYHAIHPSGFEEFSCGALVDQNSRMGVDPGEPKSTDPKGKVKQPYTSRVPSGGFLNVKVEPGKPGENDNISFIFYDEYGIELYRETKKNR
jgi:alkaline phosphatase D